jgi:hypothetical protein
VRFLDLHAKTEYKSCTESNIQQVVENSDHHRGLRVLHPDEKTLERIGCEHRRSAPDAHAKIGLHGSPALLAGLYQAYGKFPIGYCAGESATDSHAHNQDDQHVHRFVKFRAPYACAANAAAHPDKSEIPVDHVEDVGPNATAPIYTAEPSVPQWQYRSCPARNGDIGDDVGKGSRKIFLSMTTKII